jgi:hypothetical protein
MCVQKMKVLASAAQQRRVFFGVFFFFSTQGLDAASPF